MLARAALTAESLTTIRESVLGRGTTLAHKTQNGIKFANQVIAGVRKIAEASELTDNPLNGDAQCGKSARDAVSIIGGCER